MTLLAALVLWRIASQESSVRSVEHTDQVIHRTNDAQTELLRMALAIRSYWLTADKQYLADFQRADRTLTANLAALSILVADNPAQGKRLMEVSSGKGAWIGSIQMLISQPNAARSAAVRLGQLDAQVAKAADTLNQVMAEEERLRTQRSTTQSAEDRTMYVLVPLLCGIAALILGYWGLREIDQAGRQFERALARAEDANRAKDNFLATISHELRNPLNSILLSAAVVISDQGLSESGRQRVKAIERAARNQAQLIDDLLDVSRIESGRLRVDVQPTDLTQVVKVAAESMRLAAEAKSIKLQEIIDTSVSLIAGDAKRLEQVVWNLLSNAIKFTPKGGKIQVRLERIDSHVEIVIVDNGRGISPVSLPRIFERFWQETETGPHGHGLGLGLSIVKELVELHGGTVTAHSDGLGQGSTFTVRLPLPPASAPLLEPRRHPTVASVDIAAAAPRLDGLTLLVVDDETEACNVLTNLLGSLGATVHAQKSAEASLSMLDEHPPDAIIADIGMPDQDGFSFARELRKREQEKSSGHVPLIALTAYGRVDDKVKILASGFDSHVVKPVELAELAATIRSLVTARAA